MEKERADRIKYINKWIREWCREQGFSYLFIRTSLEESGLLREDAFHLSEKEKAIFGKKLSKLIRRDIV